MKVKYFILFITIISSSIFSVKAEQLQAVAWNQFSSTTYLKENEETITNIGTIIVSTISDNQSEYYEPGYIEFIEKQSSSIKSIGLNIKGNTGAITHCFKFNGSAVSICNNGTVLSTFGYTKGDRFRIEFTGSTIKYYRNNIGLVIISYTYSGAVYFNIKAILESVNATFSGVKTTMKVGYAISKPTDKNYIHTITPLKAVSTISTTAEHKTGDFIESVSYFDGLGRPTQTIYAAASPNLRDVVEPTYYDQYGLQSKKYLPYTIKNSTSIFRGTERSNPITEQTAFYTNYFTTDANFAYTDIDIEHSQLNRMKSTTGEGTSWKTNTKKTQYFSTSNTTNIMRIKIDEAVTPVKFYLENSYPINSLFLSQVTDEDGRKTEEFKDKNGKLILKRQFIGTRKISTYYVYDDFGLLRLVVQPTGASQLETIFSTLAPNTQSYISDNIFLNNCFYYTYDSKHRISNKYLPGNTIKYPSEYTGSTKYVYNKNNQIILTQEPNLKASNKWQFIKYDQFNRPIITGIYTHPVEINEIQMQALADNYSYLGYDHRDITEAEGYSTTYSFPYNNLDIYTVTYYDDYNYPVISGYAYSPVDNFSYNPFYSIDGKITGQKVKILGTSSYLYSVNYYNDNGQLIQTQSDNSANGTDIITTEYDFTGNIILQLTNNTVRPVINGPTINYQLLKRYVYDQSNRLVDAYEKVNSEAEVQLSRTTINELGQVKEKDLHRTFYKSLQSIDYSYNIRGWLTGINNTDLNDGEGDLFGMKLMYNDLGSYTTGNETKIQYNGNISAIEWYGAYTGTTPFTGKHANVYQYDDMNRLSNSKYYKNVTTRSETNNFDFAATYDDNGNFNTMQQKTIDNGLIDNLTYTYLTGGNKLKAVGDVTTDVAGRGDFSEISTYEGTTNTEYVYDASGNMIEDKNRNIVIQYNEYNLPTLVTIGANSITYRYDALGNRLNKRINGTNSKYYCGEFVYSSTDLLYANTSEGRIVKENDGSSHRYEYFIKDHLGNTRMVFSSLIGYANYVDKIQEDSYFPFGLKMPGFSSATSGTTPTKQLFNGKELQDDIVGFGFYDYGARFYDPALGRWHSVDPLADVAPDWSPYRAFYDNPIVYSDPTGMLESTHTDQFGNVVAVYNDGDLGVYKHKGNAAEAKKEVEKNYSKKNTSAGGQKMGETPYWDEFLDADKNDGSIIKGARIDFNGEWNTMMTNLYNDAKQNTSAGNAIRSLPGNKFDPKSNSEYAPYGVGTGKKLNGKYISARSAGNYLAGMIGANTNITFDNYMQMAGSLHVGGKYAVAMNLSTRNVFGPPPFYGENNYCARMIILGWLQIKPNDENVRLTKKYNID